MTNQPRPDERERESQRILERTARQSDPSLAARGLDRAARHLKARDAEAGDAVELWGARIGRALGLLVTLAIIVWLAVAVFGD